MLDFTQKWQLRLVHLKTHSIRKIRDSTGRSQS
jgi:hypothetical protein